MKNLDIYSETKTFADFLQRQGLDESSQERFKSSTSKILERSGLFSGTTGHCQLVVGQVQSGKTMSFTGLIALARDNRFPLTIVVAGTKKNLYEQSAKRLSEDLEISGDGGANPWRLIKKPNFSNVEELVSLISNWNDATIPLDFLQTGLLVVLKSKAGLEKTADLFEGLSQRIDLSNFPVLIIDDEADQASLNTSASANLKKADGVEKASGVYSALKRLREAIPRHTFVMYTATPQAPLLIKLADHLSPEFVTLLTPGDAYLGGADLFGPDIDFARTIPEEEMQLALSPTSTDGPPKSLRESLAYFLLALTIAQERRNPRPLSMMIHPSSSVELHDSYERWTRAIVQQEWKSALADKCEDAFENVLLNDFLPALLELKKTTALPQRWSGFVTDRELLEDMLFLSTRHWIDHTEIRVINSANPDIRPDEWPTHAAWILIGGNKLERGFTVENLAVTYMPRGRGVGNADVIQQRGRFFGYKKKYSDILRGWLSDDSIQNYGLYVEHESEMHKQLMKIDESGESLKSWRRKFLLDKSLKICRTQVQGLPVAHEQLRAGFAFKQSQLFHKALQNQDNFYLHVIKLLTKSLPFEEDLRTDRRCMFGDLIFTTALDLLADWPASEDEREQIDRIIFAMQRLNDEGKAPECKLVLMDVGSDGKQVVRKRSISVGSTSEKDDQRWRITNLFQGRNPKSGLATYPGDDEIRFEESLTLQIHRVAPETTKGTLQEVTALAISIPDSVSKGVVWQIGE